MDGAVGIETGATASLVSSSSTLLSELDEEDEDDDDEADDDEDSEDESEEEESLSEELGSESEKNAVGS